MSKRMRMLRPQRVLLAGMLLVAQCSLAPAAEGGIDWNTDTLTGDWNGTRGAWTEKGVNTELLFKGTLMSSPTGGAKKGTDYMQNLESKIALDGAKLWNIPDSSAYIHLILNSGGKMNAAYVGSLMGVDNSEAAENNLKLFQAWFNKDLFEATVSVLAGIYPVDTEFYVTDSSGIFLHPSFGMAAEVAQTGASGPSIYPLAALGMRVKYQPVSTLYAQAALADGNPGKGRHPHWTRVNPVHGDGSLFMAEFGYRPGEAHHMEPHIEPPKGSILTLAEELEERYEPIGKYAIGYWSYSQRFDDLLDSDRAGNPVQRKNRGIYVLAESSLYRAADMERDVSAFFRYGRAEKNINVFDYSTSVGVRVRGLLNDRPDDFFGLAATRAHASEKFRLAQAAAGIAGRSHETVVEAAYRAQVSPWLAITPNVQRIFNPGLAPEIRNATVIGVRCEISL